MLILSITGSLLAFDQFLLLTNGGPDNSTTSVVMLAARAAFFGFNSAALSVMLLVALNALQLRVLRKDHTK